MKNPHSTTAQTRNIKAPTWGFWLWLTAVMLTTLIVAVIVTAWAVHHAMTRGPKLSPAQSRFVMSLAEFPGLVRVAIEQQLHSVGTDPVLLLIDKGDKEQMHWLRSFPSLVDSGYLLLSGVDPLAKSSTVQLIRISDGISVARWEPDWPEIYTHITSKKFVPAGSPAAAQAGHPLLLADGDIVFNTQTSLVRMSPCSHRPVWVLDEVMHHSIELDSSGAIWVPSVSEDGFSDIPWLRDRIRDDSLTLISTDGKVLENRSFVRILRDNGLQALLLGTYGASLIGDPMLIGDPIHINQIRVATRDSQYWMRGDLLISARHLSTIFLYRPSTGKIIWHQTGPWMNQHSVDFVDNHRISVFDNNVIAGVPNEHAFLRPSDTNQVLVYDFSTRKVTQPFAALLAEARPLTVTDGRARILPDGGLFIEETKNGRHLRFTQDRLLWSRVNDYDDKRIGTVSWSTYLTAEEASVPLKALASRQCHAAASSAK